MGKLIKTFCTVDNKTRYYEIFQNVNKYSPFPFDANFQQVKCENEEFHIGSCNLKYALREYEFIIGEE